MATSGEEAEAANTRAAKLEHFKHALSHHSALSTALVGFMQTTLRVSILLNGGAVIAALSLYSSKGDKLGTLAPFFVAGAIVCWLAGLIFSAQATRAITQAQREFQALAGNAFSRLGWDYFGIKLDAEDPDALMSRGTALRDDFYRFWLRSIVAFAAGAVVALIALLCGGAGSGGIHV